METQGTEMSPQELADALQATNEENYGGTSDFSFDISREKRFYEERISKLLQQQHPELSHEIKGTQKEIKRILEGILKKDQGIMAEYIKTTIAA